MSLQHERESWRLKIPGGPEQDAVNDVSMRLPVFRRSEFEWSEFHELADALY